MSNKGEKWIRNCPECGEGISYSTKSHKVTAERRNTNCPSCVRKGKNHYFYGKKRSEETKQKMRGRVPWNKGKTDVYSEEALEKMSDGHKGQVPWNKGKTNVYSEEVLKNWRLSALKRNGITFPNYNKIGCEIIHWFNMYYDFNFQHAENGGEVCIGGYFPDGLDESRKTIIEIDEPRHFNADGTYKEKDIRRQRYLEDLGYKFIRIRI